MMHSGQRSVRWPERKLIMSHRFEGDFSRLIRHRREDLTLTQAEVAEQIGVTPDCVTLVELGYRRFDLDRIPALADALKLNRRQLCRQALRERAPELYRQLFRQRAA
jgi:transcriptional regulator with XRE-family HTH domain